MCALRLVLLLTATVFAIIQPASFAPQNLHPPWINRPIQDEFTRSPQVIRPVRAPQDNSPNVEDRYGPWSGRPNVGPNLFQNGFNWNGRNNRRNNGGRNRPSSDAIFFRDDDNFVRPNLIQPNATPTTAPAPAPAPAVPSSTVAIPGMETTRSACEDLCQVTSQYNPVCGSDTLTYFNMARLSCAQNCGKRVRLLYYGSCTRIPQN